MKLQDETAAQWHQRALAAYRLATAQYSVIDRGDRTALLLAIEHTERAGSEVQQALTALYIEKTRRQK